MKKLLILLAVPLILSGCLGIGEEEGATGEPTAGEIKYNHTNFSISIPQDWEIIEEADFTSNIPTEIIVDFRNNIKSEIFTANLNVSAINVEEGISASDLAINSKTKAEDSLVSFEGISSEKIDVPYGEGFVNGERIIFSGKKNASDPIIYFEQIYVIRNGVGYVVTAASLPEENETVVNYLNRMLNSFALK
jgi:hypothetical protein